MPNLTLEDLYIDQLKDLYDAENQLLTALPKMASAAHSAELKKAFTEHLEQTRQQVRRLQKILSDLGQTTSGERCEAMEGIIRESEGVSTRSADPDVKDAALIAAAQRVEHYEMAGYGAVRAFAKRLDYHDAADMLNATLEEEGEADKQLTRIAEGHLFRAGVNKKADKR